MTAEITERCPIPRTHQRYDAERDATRALEYMGLRARHAARGLRVDRVFLGLVHQCQDRRSSGSGRIVARGRRVAAGVRAMVVPGSQRVKAQAEREGLDRIFTEAGFEWRNPGCSMCLGMNEDILATGRALRRHLEPELSRGGRGGAGARTS